MRIKRSKKTLSALLLIALILTPVISFAETENNEEEQTPYEQFSLVTASKPVIPLSPFGDHPASAEDGKTIASYEDWWLAKYEQQETVVPYFDKIQAFTQKSAQLLLSNSGESNALYSPINIWYYLEILANLTEGDSQAQVMRSLGLSEEPNSVIDNEALYKALYWDDGLSIYRPASSLWINQRTHLSDPLAARLATKCHTSVFQGPMGEEVFDRAFQSWLNEQTNYLFEDVVGDLGFERDTGLSLCTTLYMRCSWSLPFNKDDTYSDVFYSHDGITTVDFMRKEEAGGSVYRGGRFSSVIMDLQDGGYVTFVLPDSDSDTEAILQSQELFDFLFTGRDWADQKNGRIKISMPKIDVLAATPLSEMLGSMGIPDIFNSDKVEFSEDITSEDDLKLTSIEQYSRVIMNEDGVEAASMIVSDGASLRIPYEEEIDFILNRPFVFAIFSENSIPLFIGIINTI